MYVKSPIHYMGCKYDLLPYILEQFPKKEQVSIFYDIFGGSGTVSLNVKYDNIIYNELNGNMCNLLQMLKDNKPDDLIKHIQNRIKEFELNDTNADIRCKNTTPEFIEYYKDKYIKFRDYYNKSENKDIKDLFTLSFYSFCNLMRFNSNNEFNMPYGNRCFIETDTQLIFDTHRELNNKNISIYNQDAFEILENIKENNNQFIYLDPPYTNSTAIYNENRAFGGWTIESDERLFKELDRLSKIGVKWAYSNVLSIKGRDNSHIEEWALKNKYTIIELEDKEYASLGKGNANAREVLIINYPQPVKQFTIFDYF